MLHAGAALSAGKVAAAEQAVAAVLEDGVRLAGQQGLVRLALPLQNHAVGGHLAAGRKDEDVVQHQVADGDLALLSAAHHVGPRRCDEREPVDGLFGPDFLQGADQDVADDNPHEQQVLVGAADGEHQRGENGVEDVERREQVAPYDLRDGFRADGVGAVAQTLPHALRDLLLRQARYIVRMKPLTIRLPAFFRHFQPPAFDFRIFPLLFSFSSINDFKKN